MPRSALTALALLAPLTAVAGEKVDVCHATGSGSINVLNVSVNSLSAHLAHGDHLAGTYYLDADGDGEGDPDWTSECLDPGYVDNDDDCDDSDDSVSTAAEEICGDGIDNDCDGEIDEGCTVEVEIQVAGDNGVWAWVDGAPVTFDYNEPNWQRARSATMTLDAGEDYAFAFYVEDWGGLAYFAASVTVDGVVAVSSGVGDFTSTGSLLGYVNDSARIASWPYTPSSASDSPNLLFSPSATWGDWMLPGYDDSAWQLDTNTCATPSYWNISWLSSLFPSFADLYADGAETVWHDFGYYAAGTCYSVGDNAAAFRTELSL